MELKSVVKNNEASLDASILNDTVKGLPRSIVVSNPTLKQVFTWVNTSLSFAKGELRKDQNYGVVGLPSSSRVLKTWDDGSVAILSVKHPVLMQPGQVQMFTTDLKTPDAQSFQFHASFLGWLNEGGLNQVAITATANGVPVVAHPFLGMQKVLRFDHTSIAIRFRTHFRTTAIPSQEQALSCTVYAEIEHESQVLKLSIVLGNDTLEKPVVNGINVQNFQVITTRPGFFQNEESYQGKSCLLADGQQVAFRYFICASNETIFNDTAWALSRCEIVGLASYESHQESKALMTHFDLPNKRFTNDLLPQVYNQVQTENQAPLFASPKQNIWKINQNPPATGDQPDFGAGHPMTKALQSYSLNLFNRHFVGVYRESFRPSHYWENGVRGLDYVSLVAYPNLFFWSGRPHWHPTWNPEYPVWQARGALSAGDFGGWSGQDNQHLSNNNLRAVYELTGDWYLEDLCFSNVSVTYFNFFTKWKNNSEAERTTRTMKEMCALGSLFRDTQEGQASLAALRTKAQVFDNEVNQRMAQYGVPAIAPFNSSDGRVNGGAWGQAFPGNTIAVAWQAGFNQEWQGLRHLLGQTPDLRYLAAFAAYFEPSGTPKTYFPLPDPSQYITGGIGLSWWAGWVSLAQANPQAPGASFVLERLKPLVDQNIDSHRQGFFSDADRWKAWR